MTKAIPSILVVDDEEYNIKMIEKYLEALDYSIVTTDNGAKAWELLEKSPNAFDAVVLDRIMPYMNGMDVLKKIKSHPELGEIPVIFQTVMTEDEEIMDGIEAGAYYYMTKPYKKAVLCTVVEAAVNDYLKYKHLQREIRLVKDSMFFLEEGNFEIKNLQDGDKLATTLARLCPDPGKAVIGIWELIVNAIEHGNLGITYDEKSLLYESHQWWAEVEKRLLQPDNLDKKVVVNYKRFSDKLLFAIKDEGNGFDWEKHINFSPERAFDSHGRGIPMSRMYCFDDIEYRGKGNVVIGTINR